MKKELRKLSRLEILEIMLALRDDYDLLEEKIDDKINENAELKQKNKELFEENAKLVDSLKNIREKVTFLQKNYALKFEELKRQKPGQDGAETKKLIDQIETLEAKIADKKSEFEMKELAYRTEIIKLKNRLDEVLDREEKLKQALNSKMDNKLIALGLAVLRNKGKRDQLLKNDEN